MGLFGMFKGGSSGSLSKSERADLAAEFAAWAPKNKLALKRRLTSAGLASLNRLIKSPQK